MEQAQKLQIGERITALRERSPFTQPQMAERLMIGLRAYQKLEQTGTTKYERCQEVAAIHDSWTSVDPEWKHVSADWLWDGRDRTKTPDLFGAGPNGSVEDRLSRIEERLDHALGLLEAMAVEQHEALIDQDERRESGPPAAGSS